MTICIETVRELADTILQVSGQEVDGVTIHWEEVIAGRRPPWRPLSPPQDAVSDAFRRGCRYDGYAMGVTLPGRDDVSPSRKVKFEDHVIKDKRHEGHPIPTGMSKSEA